MKTGFLASLNDIKRGRVPRKPEIDACEEQRG